MSATTEIRAWYSQPPASPDAAEALGAAHETLSVVTVSPWPIDVLTPERLKEHEPLGPPELVPVGNADPKAHPPELTTLEKTLRQRLGLAIFDWKRILRQQGRSEADAHSDINEALRIRPLGLSTLLRIGAKQAAQRSRKTVPNYRERTPAVLARRYRRQGDDGRLEQLRADQQRIANHVATALQRSRSYMRGDRAVSRTLRRKQRPRIRSLELHMLGCEDQQTALYLDRLQMALVAVYGHVNPSDIYPEFSYMRPFYDLAVVAGRLYGGYACDLTPDLADRFMALAQEQQARAGDPVCESQDSVIFRLIWTRFIEAIGVERGSGIPLDRKAPASCPL